MRWWASCSDLGSDRAQRQQIIASGAARNSLASDIRRRIRPISIPSKIINQLVRQDETRYFDIDHTANDTLDKINPTQLNQNVAAWVAMVWLASQADHDFKSAPRKTP